MTTRSLRRAAVLSVCLVMLMAPAVNHAAGTKAPHFRAKDVRGNVVDLDELRRKGPVLLDFWATWCKPCIKSLPELQAWHEEFGPQGLTVVGVSVDGPRNRSRVRPFTKRFGLDYTIVVDDDGRIQDLYQVLAIPTAVLIDTAGMVAKVRVAYRPGEGHRFEKSIRALLPAPAESDTSDTSEAIKSRDDAGSPKGPGSKP